jgi:hypothetical protein
MQQLQLIAQQNMNQVRYITGKCVLVNSVEHA